jgi:hypothetical protein
MFLTYNRNMRGRKTNPLGKSTRHASARLKTPAETNSNCPFCLMGQMKISGEVKDLMHPERSGFVYACNHCEQMLDHITWGRIQDGMEFPVDLKLRKYLQSRSGR